MDKVKKSGGTRNGAGRKSHEVKKELFRVTPDEKKMILEMRAKIDARQSGPATIEVIPKPVSKIKIDEKNTGKSLKQLLSEI